MFDFGSIQFEHNAFIDSLTDADAQTIFFDNLVKAVSNRKRSGGALLILTLEIIAPKKGFKKGGIAAKRQISDYEESLKRAARIINKNLRREDSFTRMAVNGFYILIRGEKKEEQLTIERFKKLFADRATYKIEAHPLVGDLTATQWLNQIDMNYFRESSNVD